MRGGAAFPDRCRELAHHRLERFAFGEGRRPCVAEPVGDHRVGARDIVEDLLPKVDTAVVYADALLRVEVIPHDCALRTADDHLPDLGGAQPIDMRVCDRAALQRHREVTHARLACADRVAADRADGEGG